MTAHRALLVITVVLLATACRSKTDSSATSKASADKTADKSADDSGDKRADETAGEPAKAEAKPDVPPSWNLKIEKKRPLAGASVVATVDGPLTRFNLVGSSAVVRVEVRDVAAPSKRPTVHSVQIAYPGGKQRCGYTSATPELSTGLTVRASPGRFELTGEVTCKAIDTTPATVHKAAISGYFEAP